MDEAKLAAEDLGNEPPLVASGRSGPPDRREISARWLSGTFLTGITSTVLMGVALFAALDGREGRVVMPAPQTPSGIEGANLDAEIEKAARLVRTRTLANITDRRRMEVSMLIRDGDRDVVRTQPFVHVNMALAAGHTTSRRYPSFDPLEVFAEDGTGPATDAGATTGQIYGANVESEVSLRTTDFPLASSQFDLRSELSAEEIETTVRSMGAILTDGDIQVAALHYVDPQRFGESFAAQTLGNFGVRVVPENVTVAPRDAPAVATGYAEDIVPVRETENIETIFTDAGYGDDDSIAMADALGRLIETDELSSGAVLRIGIETREMESRIMRVSLYRNGDHRGTVALDDGGQFVPGDEPEPNPAISLALQGTLPPVEGRQDLPTVYDGVYRAALSYGLTRDMTRQLIRLFASEVDYQARLDPSDTMELFFSRPDEENHAGAESELLYVSASFGGTLRTYYRFRSEDGSFDFFDEDGRSARQFLLRNPVPNGRFTSGFGSRRHPILGYSRMHTGVDWAAPRGTPIIAAGNGVVEEAGWSGGYGRQTLIRHANGYVSSYSHQNAIADGVVPGARIRQGQVIGYVGSTGMSTGNHLHYELIVNGTKVDPMRVRLPTNRALEGEELEVFQNERQRIDALLADEAVPPLRMAGG